MVARSFNLPSWARRHVALVLGIALALAVILRAAPTPPADATAGDLLQYRTVSAAIGLSQQLPVDAALATWINSAIYSAAFHGISLVAPDVSAFDFCVAFISDPARFCLIARYATLLAGVISVFLAYALVSRLLDPVAGAASAFVLAIHPAAVELGRDLDSGAYCLLYLLCGLLVAVVHWRNLRPLHAVAIGLCLGFATDAIPLAALAFALIVVIAAHTALRERKADAALTLAIGVASFLAAAMAVMPAVHSPGTAADLFLTSAAVIAGAILVWFALRHLRTRISAPAYSSLVLCVGVIVALPAISGPAVERAPVDVPTVASRWIADNLPSHSLVALHANIADHIVLPRSASCWTREVTSPESSRSYSRIYALAAAEAATRIPGPAFDVMVSADPVATAATAPSTGAPHFVVLPDAVDLADRTDGEYWLVARFRGQQPGAQGVAIWGTAAGTPQSTPAHAYWIMRHAGRLAALPSAAS
ncbi:MAG: hypothetical protein GX131_19225 [candidate division WS1 bacterium]|jgi:hypothetical protein|nr:hypothetical protein [candidate division WS1 bacterium]